MKFVCTKPTPILKALQELYPDSSKRTLQNWLKAGRFSVDGKVVKKTNVDLEPGQEITSQNSFNAPRVPGITILYEDRYLIAIDKPKGLLSTPLDGGSLGEHALGKLRKAYQTEQIFAAHRIDRETSGVLLFARGKLSAQKLGDLFEAHDLTRRYFAICEGNFKEDTGTWECPLLELPSLNVIESPEGKQAITHFEVYRRSAKYTYVHFTLETGKKHQIRAHSKRAGHPIVGDKRYGSTENPLKRLCLHSTLLEFVHPFTGETISIKAPLPKSFQVLGGQIKVK